jgi:hypothetical protein
MLLVRLGWGGRRGAAPLGWALALAALTVAGSAAGAWGVAMTTLLALGTALVALAHAGWTSPSRPWRAPRTAPAIGLTRQPLELGRRAAVFLLVVPVAFAAALWLAFGMQAMARAIGANAADVTVLTLFVQPVAWAAILTIQMTRADTARMIVAPAVAAMIGTACWVLA